MSMILLISNALERELVGGSLTAADGTKIVSIQRNTKNLVLAARDVDGVTTQHRVTCECLTDSPPEPEVTTPAAATAIDSAPVEEPVAETPVSEEPAPPATVKDTCDDEGPCCDATGAQGELGEPGAEVDDDTTACDDDADDVESTTTEE